MEPGEIKAITKSRLIGNVSGGGSGGESVSPTLFLNDVLSGDVRTTITEQEKSNLEKGLYNQVVYSKFQSPNDLYLIYSISKLFDEGGGYQFMMLDNIVEKDEQKYFTGASLNTLIIGEKNTSGEYPITIEDAGTFILGKPTDYKSINLFGNHSILVPNASTDTEINLYNHFIKITGNASEVESGVNIIARFTIQSSNNLVVDTPEKLATLLGNEFELGCNGIYGNYNITGLKKTADGTLNIIYNNGGAESLQSVASLTISISDKVKTV